MFKTKTFVFLSSFTISIISVGVYKEFKFELYFGLHSFYIIKFKKKLKYFVLSIKQVLNKNNK